MYLIIKTSLLKVLFLNIFVEEDHLRKWSVTFVTETSENKDWRHAHSDMFETGGGWKKAREEAKSERASWQLSH